MFIGTIRVLPGFQLSLSLALARPATLIEPTGPNLGKDHACKRAQDADNGNP
jgi:hypothetical protein